QVLARHGVSLKTKFFDSLLESYILNSSTTRHDLNSLALKYLSRATILFEEIAGKGAKQLTFDKIPLDKATSYAAQDADVALQLHQALWPLLTENPNFESLFTQIDMPLMPILATMEMHGVLIDANMLKQQSMTLQQRIQMLEAEAYQLAGCTFN